MELERNLAAIRKQGLGVAAISYDSVAVLKNFADRQHITFPLLSDSGSQTIRAFGILNETVKPDTAFYGIPYPGTFIVNAQGKVTVEVLRRRFPRARLRFRHPDPGIRKAGRCGAPRFGDETSSSRLTAQHAGRAPRAPDRTQSRS